MTNRTPSVLLSEETVLLPVMVGEGGQCQMTLAVSPELLAIVWLEVPHRTEAVKTNQGGVNLPGLLSYCMSTDTSVRLDVPCIQFRGRIGREVTEDSHTIG